MKKHILFTVTLITMSLMIFLTISARAETKSGVCGDGVNWIYEDGTLTISGDGSITDYNNYNHPVHPWYTYDFRSDIKNVVIEEGVTRIGTQTFFGCINLTDVEIPNSVTSIGPKAFYSCSNLVNINIPSSVKYIGSDAFYNCSELSSIEIPDGVTEIAENTFYNCYKLAHIKIPDTVIKINWHAFSNTAYVNNEENWNNGWLYIDNCLLRVLPEKMSSSLVIKNGTTAIAPSALAGCNCASLSIPSSVSPFITLSSLFGDVPDTLAKVDINSISISNDFASGCTNLARVNIGDAVKTIGNSAFKGCTNLRFLNFGENVTTISQNAFDGCTALSEITLPPSLQTIEQNAFSNCYNLDKIVIPNTVTTITGDGVFSKRTVIYGYRGSAAQEYAENYGYTFNELDADEYVTSSTAKRINDTIVLSTSVNSDISRKTLHIALYDNNNMLLDYMLVPTKNSTDNAYVVFKNNPDVSYAKVYIWDSMKTMVPTAKAEKVVIQ